MLPPRRFTAQAGGQDRMRSQLLPPERQETRTPPPSGSLPIGSPSRPSTSRSGQIFYQPAAPPPVPLSPSRPPLYSRPAALLPTPQLPSQQAEAPYDSPTWGGYVASSFCRSTSSAGWVVVEQCTPIPPSAAKCHEGNFRLLNDPGNGLPVDAVPPSLPQAWIDRVIGRYDVYHPSEPGVWYIFTMADEHMQKHSNWPARLKNLPVQLVCVLEKYINGNVVSTAAICADNEDLDWVSLGHANSMTYLVVEVQSDGAPIRKRYWQPRSALVECI